MASIKTVLRKTQLSDGKYPICLRVTKDRKSKFFKTIYNASTKEWNKNEGRFNSKKKDYLKHNEFLSGFENRAAKILGDLDLNKENYTLDDFEKELRVNTNPLNKNIFKLWDELINEMELAGRMGNARAYKDTYNSVMLFNNKSKNLSFDDVTPAFLSKYEAFLRSRGGTDGGIGVKMREIRALYNKAIERGIEKKENYPFSKYKISRLKGKGIKRALGLKEVQKIINIDLSNHPHLVNSRNYFVFSFYTRGMNFADMMKLRFEDISEDRIYYVRSKTNGNFIVKILPPVKEIISYYQKRRINKYLFPILLKENLTPQQLENRKKKALKKYNKDLKEIAKLCKIQKSITSYVARHSYANCLKEKGVATDIISESMGHQDLATTKAYLKELDSSLLDQASELLL
ncbi:site-specific integrase [Joostella sp. CR20]|uniref:site-specific integrase n=1 Tax=Joostella sp. CR20 TaxID=2804312 RepID=UPI00313D7C6C